MLQQIKDILAPLCYSRHRGKPNKKRGQITEFNGCVATGKEANVYHARGSGLKEEAQGLDPNRELAIKIYKTSILIFKDRERYITGEFRFRNGYCKSNPRKMVSVWCEKEIRNLKRIQPILKMEHLPKIKKTSQEVFFAGKAWKGLGDCPFQKEIGVSTSSLNT